MNAENRDGQPGILRVAVAGPMPGFFDYLPIPATASRVVAPGSRVLVPFGRGSRMGLIASIARESAQPRERLKPIERVMDPGPLLGPAELDLILWAAHYYRHPPGDALFTALPGRLRRAQPLLDEGEAGWRLTRTGRTAPLEALARAPVQMRIAVLLRDLGGHLPQSEIRCRLGDCLSALRGLAIRGWIERCRIEAPGSMPGSMPGTAAPEPSLNAHQGAAVESVLRAPKGFHAFLLDGVTGSGKTEVYIRLIRAKLDAGGNALVLVPEIGLTPQLQRRFRERVGAPMATLHSALSPGERERAWRLAAEGRARLILGTRSAVFVPIPRLGLILVDEEHDLSFKQQEGFRYSARDLAVRRAQKSGCPVVLGSATPSLETLQNAGSGRYEWLHLPERAGGARPPRIDLVDIRSQPLRAGLSPVLVELMREQLEAGGQVLVFLNRRGFAPLLTCHDCGWVGDCPRCDARLTLHLSDNRLWCHHCGFSRPVPLVCPDCKGTDLRSIGQGTERIQGELGRLFPGLPVARVDRDSTRRKGELRRLLAGARSGEYPLLLGTQMLAKGHDLPGVTLVGILDVDQGLYGADYRAAERMAQMVIQVAGRAGRAQRPGRVILQTRHPSHPLLLTLRGQGYPAFAAAALEERREAALPPFSHQALLRADAGEPQAASAFLQRALEAGRTLTRGGVLLLGPVPAPMERRAGRYRAQLLAQSDRRGELHRFLSRWTPLLRTLKGRHRTRWSLDVDPQDML